MLQRIGIIGNGYSFARRAQSVGLEPVLCTFDEGERRSCEREGVRSVAGYGEFMEALDHPRIFVVAEEPGPDIDRVIDEAYVVMEPGDVVVDPSGSYWGDTLRRFRRMRHRSLYYVDIAFIDSSSGPLILASGDEKGVELARPALEFLASPGRVIHAGGAGAAHYALAVCEGVRTALAHAQSEAQQLFEAFPNELRVPEVVKATEMGGTEPATRASWILDDAVRLEAAVPLMAQAVMLEMAAALEEHRSIPPPPRIGPFVHPDDIL